MTSESVYKVLVFSVSLILENDPQESVYVAR